MQDLLNFWRLQYVKGEVIRIPMTHGLATVFMVVGSLLRGAGYELLVRSEDHIAAKTNSMIGTSLALRNRWLYKYATRIVADAPEIKARAEREMAGLDVPVELVEFSVKS